jgi:succinoglycan biosynthesis transport protein ExoP
MSRMAPKVQPELETLESWIWSNPRTLTLADIFLIIRRRLWLAVFPVLLVMLPGIWLVSRMPDTYTAYSTVVVQAPKTTSEETRALPTEVKIMTSERLARRAIDETGLDKLSEFNPALAPPSSSLLSATEISKAIEYVTGVFGSGRLVEANSVIHDASNSVNNALLQDAEIMQKYRQRLTVSPIGESRVIAIEFTAGDPLVAARVANLVPKLYITQQLDAKYQAKLLATEWLRERIADQERKAEAQERAIEDARAKAGIIEGRTTALITEQISAVSMQLIGARAESHSTSSRLLELQSVLEKRGSRAILEMAPGPGSTALLSRDIEARQKLAELQGNLGPSHPLIINAKTEIQGVQQKIRDEATSLVAAVGSEAAIAQQRARTLEINLNELQSELVRMKQAEVEVRSLERDASAQRTLLDEYRKQVHAQEQMSMEQPDAYILSTAALPALPSGPKRKMLVIGTAAVTLVLWLGLVIILELLDNGINSTDELKRHLGTTPLGLVPKIPWRFHTAAARGAHVVKRPNSAYAEGVRNVANSLMIAGWRRDDRGSGSRFVLITSSMPKEGKTTFVASLGRLMAMRGERVLIIDADTRRPSLHRLFGNALVDANPALELTDGQFNDRHSDDRHAAKRILTDTATGAHIVSAATIEAIVGKPFTPTVLKRLRAMVKQHYDLVLIDAPPVIPVADTRIMASFVDQCVMVVRWHKMSAQVVRYGLEQLQSSGAEVTGTVLTQVNSRRHKLYGTGDSAATTRAASRYHIG